MKTKLTCGSYERRVTNFSKWNTSRICTQHRNDIRVGTHKAAVVMRTKVSCLSNTLSNSS